MVQFEELEELSEETEEYQMLLEVAKELKKEGKVSTVNSGKATRLVIHKHLSEKGINLTQNPEVKIREVKTRKNLLYLLKKEVSSDKSEYSVQDLYAVLKIVNNAVGEDYQDKIKETFKDFEQVNKNLRFGVVVLSENSIVNPYMHRLRQENFGSFAKLFTLIVRKRAANKLYLKETIKQLLRDGELKKPEENGLEDLMNWSKN